MVVLDAETVARHARHNLRMAVSDEDGLTDDMETVFISEGVQ
jgi:hypothetical protein